MNACKALEMFDNNNDKSMSNNTNTAQIHADLRTQLPATVPPSASTPGVAFVAAQLANSGEQKTKLAGLGAENRDAWKRKQQMFDGDRNNHCTPITINPSASTPGVDSVAASSPNRGNQKTKLAGLGAQSRDAWKRKQEMFDGDRNNDSIPSNTRREKENEKNSKGLAVKSSNVEHVQSELSKNAIARKERLLCLGEVSSYMSEGAKKCDDGRKNILDAECTSSRLCVSEKSQQNKPPINWKLISFMTVSFIIIVVVLVVILLSKRGKAEGPDQVTDSNRLEFNRTSSPLEWIVTLPIPTLEKLDDPNSPQFYAMTWLEGDPKLEQWPVSSKLVRFVLATLYFSTNGARWENNTNWLDYGIQECEWYGVQAKTKMYASSEQLVLDSCTTISDMQLESNGLNGTIPLELGLLSKLEILNLGKNLIKGTVPDELGGLKNLAKLDLSGNEIYGSLPKEIKQLRRLQNLTLQNNMISGKLPAELRFLTSLEHLDISNNHLSGTIQTYIGEMVALRTLLLSNNKLSGTISTKITHEIMQLRMIDLSNNQVTGTIPTKIGHLKIEKLILDSNNFSGTIPTQLSTIPKLYHISFRNNSFTGSIPTSLGELDWLQELKLSNNNLTSTIPSELGLLKHAAKIHLFDNSLYGQVPNELCNLFQSGNLQELNIDCGMINCTCGCTCGYE